jgi:two-component system LytT family response regulator
MIKTIIIDDEPPARNLLKLLIEDHFRNELELVGIAKDEKEAYQAITELNPDLVFLDIELGKTTAFNLLSRFTGSSFAVIFVTAYKEYAVQAFKVNAIDYLVKPFELDELKAAVERAVQVIQKEKHLAGHLRKFMNGVKGSTADNKITINTATETKFVAIEDIIRCEADGNATICFLSSGQTIYATRTLKDFEEKLANYQFLRVHNKHLVNQRYIVNYRKRGRTGILVLKDGSTINVSARKKKFLNNVESI